MSFPEDQTVHQVCACIQHDDGAVDMHWVATEGDALDTIKAEFARPYAQRAWVERHTSTTHVMYRRSRLPPVQTDDPRSEYADASSGNHTSRVGNGSSAQEIGEQRSEPLPDVGMGDPRP